jgi:hypothetical protein
VGEEQVVRQVEVVEGATYEDPRRADARRQRSAAVDHHHSQVPVAPVGGLCAGRPDPHPRPVHPLSAHPATVGPMSHPCDRLHATRPVPPHRRHTRDREGVVDVTVVAGCSAERPRSARSGSGVGRRVRGARPPFPPDRPHQCRAHEQVPRLDRGHVGGAERPVRFHQHCTRPARRRRGTAGRSTCGPGTTPAMTPVYGRIAVLVATGGSNVAQLPRGPPDARSLPWPSANLAAYAAARCMAGNVSPLGAKSPKRQRWQVTSPRQTRECCLLALH